MFYAEGPDIRPGVKLKPFENVNVYPLLAKILGLDAPPTDGSPGVSSRGAERAAVIRLNGAGISRSGRRRP